jgi:hypothetical protein
MLTRLNLKVNIDELRTYYSTVVTEFDYLLWSWNRYSDTIVKQWKDSAYEDLDNLKTYGWAIQSNLLDNSQVCPPWNISAYNTGEYKNTSLVFGIIKKLMELIPYAERWAISVQPQGGKVSLHTDQADEVTVWIPIYTAGPVVTFVEHGRSTPVCLTSDGSVYLLDTTVPHFTYNSATEERVAIIFRVNKRNVPNLMELTTLL